MFVLLDAFALLYLLVPTLAFQFFILIKNLQLKKGITPSDRENVPVSVVICARNEFENLKKNLPSILNQNYPYFEVVVVNDRSWDDSRFFLEDMAGRHARLKVVHVPENDKFWSGKKFALTLGIKAASYDNLLFTDADCRPSSQDWISEMMSGYSNADKKIVLGYGGYEKRPGLLNLIIRFETLQTGWLYLTSAIAGMPFMAVGRNLSYTRDLFFQAKGFSTHMHIPSGDDDLFVNQTATHRNTSVVINPRAITVSTPKSSWSDYIYQRRRHFTTSAHYHLTSKVYLAIYQLSRMLVFLISAISLAGSVYGIDDYIVPLLLTLTYYSFRWYSLVTFGKLSGDGTLGWWYPLMSVAVVLVQLRVWIENLIFGSPKAWKRK